MTLNYVVGRLDEKQARQHLETLRWPNGARCPFCRLRQVTKLNGKRQGFYQCNHCRKQFTVRTGTIFERSHVPLSKWLQAVHLLCASKKGMSALQVSRMLGVTYKTAWFLCHRIRHAMNQGGLARMTGTIEVDETYVGGIARNAKRGRGAPKKTPVVALVQRNGQVRTRVVESVSAKNLRSAMLENVRRDATIMTDEFSSYRGIGTVFKGGHYRVNHSKGQYAQGFIHTNTVESFFALLKRGMVGTFHHVSRAHLQRYCDEFAFRWDTRKVTDTERVQAALRLAEGKRLLYRSLTDGKADKTQAN
ncbi:MAG: hypothetical protein A3B78_00090 [Omnitrophica WOR_2 bacterium RIFCSPHIGHO2_02_FULL_67_20]|nr:MAG: hypothetical protein A3B78_00090 [Omnitrophica WOR_2 bacterium RIFCSPHIGHO2_02_FULL_67_20]